MKPSPPRVDNARKVADRGRQRGEVAADSDRLRVLLEYEVPLAEILSDFYY